MNLPLARQAALGCVLGSALLLSACATSSSSRGGYRFDQQARQRMEEAIRAEPSGDYYIGRRYYKKDYRFWGHIREPGKPWTTSRLVMLNEQRLHAPDREAWKIGSDHNYEYKVRGFYSGDTVYEPASNMFYPEFVLTGIELSTTTPGPIFRNRQAQDPATRVIEQPF